MGKGICKLTGNHGKFVDSHLIPKALTRPAGKGLPFIEARGPMRPVRRWSSWRDDKLVTQHGEDILSALDNWAIVELRKQKLVWSGWGPVQSMVADHDRIQHTPWGVRAIEGMDGHMLRLFFLSLLWRAAATARPEFSEVEMPASDL